MSSAPDALERQPEAGWPTLHCFSGSKRELARAVEMAYRFSIGPAMLLSERGRKLVQLMPPDGVLTETDGPFVHLDGRAFLPETSIQSIRCFPTYGPAKLGT
ncbi:TatD family hydrolase [Stenotrophomonas sp. 2MCAF14_2]|uniref:TatD family hydrolase n=1 Tax=Stenotrophomonas sp. 2MCAF14_2 TaxID=3232983 RepID=UPI003F9C7B46